jgi:DNA-binding NarL/FixJ family response regulator
MQRQIKVLIVEDHEVTARGLRESLVEAGGIDVVGMAGGVQEGLDLLASTFPDVVLLDLHMPGKLGPKAIAESFLSKTKARVVVLSADDRMAVSQLMLGLGVAGYLVKTERSSRIAEVVKKVFAGETPFVSAQAIKKYIDLTPSERHLLSMLALGRKYAEMGAERDTAPATVRKQCESLMIKLDLKTREELIAWAVENGYAVN